MSETMREPTTEGGRRFVDRHGTGKQFEIVGIEAEARATERALVEGHRPEIAVDTDDSTWLDCSCDNWERNSPLDWWQHIWAAVDKRLAKNDQAGTKPSMRR